MSFGHNEFSNPHDYRDLVGVSYNNRVFEPDGPDTPLFFCQYSPPFYKRSGFDKSRLTVFMTSSTQIDRHTHQGPDNQNRNGRNDHEDDACGNSGFKEFACGELFGVVCYGIRCRPHQKKEGHA